MIVSQMINELKGIQTTHIYTLFAKLNGEEKILMKHETTSLHRAKDYFRKVYTGNFEIGYFANNRTLYQVKKVYL